MDRKILIAAIVALTAAPATLARGHNTHELYVGGDLGMATYDDFKEACQGQLRDASSNNIIPVSVSINTTVILRFPEQNNKSTQGDCKDSVLAPRLVIGYQFLEQMAVEGFFSFASGFESTVNARPMLPDNYAQLFGGGLTKEEAERYAAFVNKQEVDHFNMGLVLSGSIEVTRDIMLKGKLGLQRTNVDATQTDSYAEAAPADNTKRQAVNDARDKIPLRTFTGKQNETKTIYGVGVSYWLTDDLSASLGYDSSDLNNYLYGGVSYSIIF